MKNLIFTCLIFTSFSLLAQEKRLNWDYPVKPGDSKWAAFTDLKQKYDALQIPPNILEQLTTVELAELCLNCPLYMEYMAFNNPRSGVKFLFDITSVH